MKEALGVHLRVQADLSPQPSAPSRCRSLSAAQEASREQRRAGAGRLRAGAGMKARLHPKMPRPQGGPGAITPAQASAAPLPFPPRAGDSLQPGMSFTFTGTQKGRNFLLHFLPQLPALKRVSLCPLAPPFLHVWKLEEGERLGGRPRHLP